MIMLKIPSVNANMPKMTIIALSNERLRGRGCTFDKAVAVVSVRLGPRMRAGGYTPASANSVLFSMGDVDLKSLSRRSE